MSDFRALLIACALVGSVGASSGCAHSHIEAPDAALGRVIIYRNGVAYFERKATVEGRLTLNVPRDRVDDFLKSLTVVDLGTGKALPISYPTTRGTTGAWVQMDIALPPGRREVRLAYVTESPAWKPSYRVILDQKGQARLQSWAIVDNVSGEAWDQVEIGVGSTSALSFRYDLHSVQVVERETIDGATRLAQAPPKGGSPYGVDKGTVRLLGEVDADEVASAAVATSRNYAQVVEASSTASRDSSGISLSGTTGAESRYTVEGANANNPSFGGVSVTYDGVTYGAGGVDGGPGIGKKKRDSARSVAQARSTKPPPPPPRNGLESAIQALADKTQRVRVEGFARPGDTDPAEAALRRANTVRESLIARGIASTRIDVVGHAEVAASDAGVVRLVAVEEEILPTRASGDDDTKPRGSAHFLAPAPMTIEAGHSAMVTLFDQPTRARRVYLYDPVSPRGSTTFAFNAVRIENPSDNTLDSGPVTVYAEKRFLGEGLAEPIPPKAAAIVPFALDREIAVRPETELRDEIESLQKIERGIATTQTRRIRRTKLELTNRGRVDAEVFVRHHVPSGWTLRNPTADVERLGDDVVVRLKIEAGRTVRLELEETMPVTTAIDLRSAHGLESVEVYLREGDVDGELEKDLQTVLAARRRLIDVEDELASRREHLDGLRERVNELTAQLVVLRKVSRAQSLSADLAKRARHLGTRLDRVAAEVTSLEAERLERRIELNNLVADLALTG